MRHAVVIGATAAPRLPIVGDDRPPGLIDINGETLVGRSVRLLRDAGIDHITICTGYRADDYERFTIGQPDLHLAVNDKFATTGSMASVAVALDRVHHDVLILDSNLVYEARALDAVLDHASADCTLVGSPIGIGDEVWVYAPEGRLHSMSNVRHELPSITGTFVGITRLSSAAATALVHAFTGFVDTHGHARMEYETDALAAVACLFPIAAVTIPDLQYGRADSADEFERLIEHVWPIVGDHQPPVVT